MPASSAQRNPVRVHRRMFATMLLLAAAGLAVSIYLSVFKLFWSSPPGCGPGSGCGSVLSSRWAEVFGLPVSIASCAVYVVSLAALAVVNTSNPVLRRVAWAVLTTVAGMLLSAAAWFIFLQLVVIGSICPYCMIGHIIGILLSILLLTKALTMRAVEPQRTAPAAPTIALGLLLGGVLALLQAFGPMPVHRGDVDTSGDTVATTDGGRVITLLGGTLTFNVADEPHLGSLDAPDVFAILVDYACPHCRHLHELAASAVAAEPERFLVVVLPVALDHSCNKLIPGTPDPRFMHSCELASISLATHQADREAWPKLDQWLFDSPEPRRPASARDMAAIFFKQDTELVPNDERIQQRLQRNLRALAATAPTPAQTRVPVVLIPGVQPLIGQVDSFESIEDALAERPAPAATPGAATP